MSTIPILFGLILAKFLSPDIIIVGLVAGYLARFKVEAFASCIGIAIMNLIIVKELSISHISNELTVISAAFGAVPWLTLGWLVGIRRRRKIRPAS